MCVREREATPKRQMDGRAPSLRGCATARPDARNTTRKRACSPANAFSDPVMTIAPISLSPSIKRRASFSSATSATLSALSALGLLSVTSATRDAGRDVIMFSYFASKAETGGAAEDADAVVDVDVDMDMDMDLNVDVVNWDGVVNRVGVVRVGLRGEEKKTVVARAES